MRSRFIAKHRGIWPAAWMCGRGVSREAASMESVFSSLKTEGIGQLKRTESSPHFAPCDD